MHIRTTYSEIHDYDHHSWGARLHWEAYEQIKNLCWGRSMGNYIGVFNVHRMRLEVQDGRSKRALGNDGGMATIPKHAEYPPQDDVTDDTIQTPTTTDPSVQSHDDTVEIQDDPLSGIKFITLETK